MTVHIGLDADSGLVPTVVGTPAHVGDVTQTHALLHGEVSVVVADAGYQDVRMRKEYAMTRVTWQVAIKRGKRKAFGDKVLGQVQEWIEQLRGVEHPFQVIKKPVRSQDGPRQGADEEHGAVDQPVRSGQFGAGAQALAAPHTRGASRIRSTRRSNRQRPLNSVESARLGRLKRLQSRPGHPARASPVNAVIVQRFSNGMIAHHANRPARLRPASLDAAHVPATGKVSLVKRAHLQRFIHSRNEQT